MFEGIIFLFLGESLCSNHHCQFQPGSDFPYLSTRLHTVQFVVGFSHPGSLFAYVRHTPEGISTLPRIAHPGVDLPPGAQRAFFRGSWVQQGVGTILLALGDHYFPVLPVFVGC